MPEPIWEADEVVCKKVAKEILCYSTVVEVSELRQGCFFDDTNERIEAGIKAAIPENPKTTPESLHVLRIRIKSIIRAFMFRMNQPEYVAFLKMSGAERTAAIRITDRQTGSPLLIDGK